MDHLLADLRYGRRMLRRTPALSVVAVLTIALGVGLTTHTFSVVYGSVIRGLDFDRGTRLVSLSEDRPAEGFRGNGIPILDLVDWRKRQTSFRGLAGFTSGTVNLADEGSPPERYNGAFVTANLFEQVDGVPLLGRVFNEADDAGQGERVVILGYDVWQNRYDADADIVGRSLRANGERATIVGVMPEGFHFPFEEDVWLPLGIDPLQAERGRNRVQVVGRLLEDVSIEQADAEMDAIAARIEEQHPRTNEGVQVWVQAYEDMVMPREIVAVLWVMLIAVFGVLLIACFNVANLLLARATARSREIAVRSAMGADRGRIIRQLLLESALLAAVGGVLGVALAFVGVEAFNAAIIDIEKPYWIDIRLDLPALLFSLGITGVAALVAGTAPAIRASGAKIHELLQDQARGSSSLRMGRFSTALVVGEIALSCALLVAAGMMVKSVVNLQTREMGFDGTRVFTARLGLFEADYPDDESRRRFFDQLLEGLRAEPEAVAVGLTQNLPALGAGRVRVALEGIDYPETRDQPVTSYTTVTPGYFQALSVPISDGRDFDERDRAGNLRTVIVNESFARRHLGEESPLERRMKVQLGEGSWVTIVGVVPDLFVGGGTGGIGSDAVPPDQVFLPLAQADDVRFVSLAVRTRGDPGSFTSDARSVVSRIDPDLPLYWVRTMAESVKTATWAFEIFGSLFTLFGVAALFLAAVGLYGVMAFSVSQRTQEMGVRMAMGAEARRVMGMVLGRGMRQLAIGGAVGLALGAILVRPMAVIFYDVNPSDPMVYGAIVLTLSISGLLACLIPARRATSVDLVEALRPE